LIPFVIVLLSISLSMGVSLLGLRQQPSNLGANDIKLDPSLFSGAVFLAMILVAVGTIDMGLGDGLLAFGMSDVDYVFPSPISRRTVLAYRLPGLTMGALFSTVFLIYMYRVVFRVVHVQLPSIGHLDPPGWFGPAGVSLSVGIYLNLAMFLAIQFESRRLLHRLLISGLIAAAGILGAITYFRGIPAFASIMNSPILGWIFLPCKLAASLLVGEVAHATESTALITLLVGYLLSLVPMFATNANFYEHSIASTERVASYRKAARGGYAALQANRAATLKFKSVRTYTIKPFGTGPVALAWAHLCAAGKRPYVNFLSPALVGIGCGVLGSVVENATKDMGLVTVGLVSAYCSFGFMASAKTASESAVRRRELIAPLPIRGWETVVANLTVPWLAMFGFCLCTGLGYLFFGGRQWPIVVFGIALFFPLRLATRMILQYVLVLAYPDFADKVQQFLAMGVYYLAAAPFLILEGILVLPAFFLHSIWVGLITLTLLQVAYLFLFLAVAGLATDRAVASGEPVSLLGLVRRRGG
jgi:hypothetical protein